MGTKIIRSDRDKGYSTIDNTILRDEKISWKAKGIFTYIMSLPVTWIVYQEELIKHATDGRDSFRSGWKELENNGYIEKKMNRDNTGKFDGYEYIVIENPFEENPMSENPMSENPITDNPTLLNTNKLITKEVNTNYINNIIVEEVIKYLNSKLDSDYRKSSKKNQSLIKARINDGYHLDDFKKVIDRKYNEWINNKDMVKYLRPETLFSPKFESYLNQKEATVNEKPKGYYDEVLRNTKRV